MGMRTFKDLNHYNISAGIISGLLAITGPPAIILQASFNGNFTITQTILWMSSIYVFGGIFSILIPLYYRMPIVGAHTITGVTFLATVTSQFTYQELIGSYVIAGLLMFLIGYFGAFSKLIDYVPKQIIAAMLAGMIMKYMVNFVVAFNELTVIGCLSLVSFFIFSKWNKWIPPVIAAIFTVLILVLLTDQLNSSELVTSFVFPQIQLPHFSPRAFLSVSVPLVLLILSNDAAVGLGALEQNDYKPPVNRVITLSGIFTIIAGFFGGQSANVAGMMSAVCSDEQAGPREQRYIAAIVSGTILITFGIFSWKLVPFIQVLPQSLVSILLGFALLGVFGNSLHLSFSNPTMKISTAFALIIAAANITVLNISSPVWSLLIGTFIARYIEKQDKQ
ncbi:MAG: benzoate transporter [Peptococcaceae bacterium BICA1-8]|nr:MAG: benzoate transporter [Peptococcaceae bacterium BICA1-8]